MARFCTIADAPSGNFLVNAQYKDRDELVRHKGAPNPAAQNAKHHD